MYFYTKLFSCLPQGFYQPSNVDKAQFYDNFVHHRTYGRVTRWLCTAAGEMANKNWTLL